MEEEGTTVHVLDQLTFVFTSLADTSQAWLLSP